MSKSVSYGKLEITEVRASQRNAENVVVKTQQSITTEYTGNGKNFALANLGWQNL